MTTTARAGRGPAAQELQGQQLGVGIEAGGRLVGDQQRRAGGQQPRQQHPRPLAAGHVEHAALGQRREPDLRQRGLGQSAAPRGRRRSAAPSAATRQAGMFQPTRRSCGR